MNQEKKINIGMSNRTFLASYNNGRPDGISTYTKNLSKNLANMGQKLSFISFADGGGVSQEAPISFSYEMSFKTYAAASLVFPRKYFPTPPVDIFHITDYRSIPMNCPSVTTIYDAIPLIHPKLSNPKYRGIKNILLKKFAKNCNHVIAISKFSVDEIVNYYGVEESIISVVSLGVDRRWLEPVIEETWMKTLQERKLRPGYFLFVGLIQPRKNLSRVILAHDMLTENERKEYPLVVVGRVGWNSEDVIQELLRKCLKGEAYWFNDVYYEDELKHLYLGASVFVFPSLYEGFGLPVLEAFSCGIPVLTSNSTSLPEVSGGAALEVDPLDIDQIVHGMRMLLESTERIRRIELGKKRAANMTWSHCARNTIEVYKKILNM